MLVALTCLVWSFFSDRMENRAGLKRLATDTPLRELTADERAALALLITGSTGLDREGVLALSGPFVGPTALSRQAIGRIGGVRVMLPYDAALHTKDINVCEVVLADGMAVLIRLNDTFDVVTAQQRADQRKALEQTWTSGRLGVIEGVLASLRPPALKLPGNATRATRRWQRA